MSVERRLGLVKDVLSLDELADDGVVSVEDVGGVAERDDELGPICVLAVVGEGDDSTLGVSEVEVLVDQSAAVARLVVLGDATALKHDARVSAREGRALVGADGAALHEVEEVLTGLRRVVRVDLEHQVAQLGAVARQGEVDARVALASVVVERG